MTQLDRLRLRQLDKRFASLRQLCGVPRPSDGWIRAIRSALGMSLVQLGSRLGITRQAAQKFELGETRDQITLGTLRRVASALDCDLVYALVPRHTLAEIVDREAYAMAEREVLPIAHSMRLENQAVAEKEIENLIRDRATTIRREWPRGFWRIRS